MNEPRVIFRHCACCGKDLKIKLSSKDHWWQKRRILEGGYYFFALDKRDMGRVTFRGEMINGQLTFIPIHPWWKRNLLRLYWWIEDKLDPSEVAEYWECEKCFSGGDEEDVE